jgi:hypothetical protein
MGSETRPLLLTKRGKSKPLEGPSGAPCFPGSGQCGARGRGGRWLVGRFFFWCLGEGSSSLYRRFFVRVGAKGGAFKLPRTPPTLSHSPFEQDFLVLLLPSSLFFPALTSLPEPGSWWCMCFGEFWLFGIGFARFLSIIFLHSHCLLFLEGSNPSRVILAPLT